MFFDFFYFFKSNTLKLIRFNLYMYQGHGWVPLNFPSLILTKLNSLTYKVKIAFEKTGSKPDILTIYLYS
ncbi:hypothetical protein NBRC116602_05940 [Hyphomicrobiales bacterium 4NK60-0047b]